MLIRVCQSHIRFGHFEYFYHSQQKDKLDNLFQYCFKYHFMGCEKAEYPHLCMLQKIVANTASLIAKWQAYGFNDGVMNTDNMSIHGITFDFDPYVFLDDFNPGFVCNRSDHSGRYAFEQQPGVGLWNLNALAHAFTPYLSMEQIKSAFGQYESVLQSDYAELMRSKLGLKGGEQNNQVVVNEWLGLLAQDKRDYNLSFRLLCDFNVQGKNSALRDHFIDCDKFSLWAENDKTVLLSQNVPQDQRQQSMKLRNPNYLLRNYLAQLAIDAAEQGDLTKFDTLLEVLRDPFAEGPKYTKPPPQGGKYMEISCSS